MRLLDVSIAVIMILLLLPTLLLIQGASALKHQRAICFVRRYQLDKMLLLYQVLQGRMSMLQAWKTIRR